MARHIVYWLATHSVDKNGGTIGQSSWCTNPEVFLCHPSPPVLFPVDWQQWRTQEFFSEGVQQIQLRTEDREDGDLGAVAP